MPAKSAKQYGLMQGVLHGSIVGSGVSKKTAGDFVEKTPSKKRKKFAQMLAGHKGK
jgi:hypothetical protein